MVRTNNHADPKVCCHTTTWAIILMTLIHLLKASGAPVFTLQQGSMITVHKGQFFSQRAAKCALHNLPSVLHYLGKCTAGFSSELCTYPVELGDG